jgi:hypothetical protein
VSDVKRDTLGRAFCNGFVDRAEFGLLRVEQLYRRTRLHRWAWRAGWEIANALTSRPLRTAGKKPKAAA